MLKNQSGEAYGTANDLELSFSSNTTAELAALSHDLRLF